MPGGPLFLAKRALHNCDAYEFRAIQFVIGVFVLYIVISVASGGCICMDIVQLYRLICTLQ